MKTVIVEVSAQMENLWLCRDSWPWTISHLCLAEGQDKEKTMKKNKQNFLLTFQLAQTYIDVTLDTKVKVNIFFFYFLLNYFIAELFCYGK